MTPNTSDYTGSFHQRPLLERLLSSNTNKYSLRSHSSSFEADDERSSSEDDNSSMHPDHDDESPNERYEGEDTRLTSTKELWGWYSYGFAAEVFIICGIGSFIPITLEQIARENGVLLSDHVTPCGSSSSRPTIPGDGAASLWGLDANTMQKDNGQCVIYLLGMELNTSSFAMYTFSISVFLQALIVVSISCAADHGNYRKLLLLGFAFTGATACMLFLAAVPKVYLLGALLAIISNTCLGASFVLLNSFLPLLVRHHPTTQHDAIQQRDEDRISAETTSLLSAPVSKANHTSVELELSTKISSTGIGIGYSAGLFVQCLSILLLVSLKSTTFSLRLVIFFIGLWWFLGTIPSALWLRPRPGPSLEKGSTTSGVSTARTWLAYIAYSWRTLFRTISYARRLKDITLFLLTWFLLSDAIATVSGTAVLFAKTQLHMKPYALGLINVIATTCGILGAFCWRYLARLFNWRPHQTILACIALFEVIPLYGLLGYLPQIQRLGYFGLQQPWEMYVLGGIYGFVLGGLSSYCRSLFGELIPPGSEASFYALYAITDKGSSIFGPAIVGAIVDATGEIRPAFWFLAVLIGVPGPLVWCVDVQRGRREGREMAAEIEGWKDREREAETQTLLLRDDD